MISVDEFLVLFLLIVVIDFASRICACFYYGFLGRNIDAVETFFSAEYHLFSIRKMITAGAATALFLQFFIWYRSGISNIAFLYASITLYSIFGAICLIDNLSSIKRYIDNR